MAPSPLIMLKTLIDSMYAMGLLEEQFQKLQTLQDDETPDFVSEVITVYCNDGVRILDDLIMQLENPLVEFHNLAAPVHRLRGSSASVGAKKVKDASIKLSVSCLQKNRAGCLEAVKAAKDAFYEVRGKFQTMLQLESQVKGLRLK